MSIEKYDILVIGGGISGITTAIEAAETGYNVILVEKEAFLGGKVSGMNQYFPKLCPPYCGLEINFRRIKNCTPLRIQTSTTVTGIEGEEGNFNVTLQSFPTFVNNNCTSCGDCKPVCPVERVDKFNLGFGQTKAIYSPHDLAFPSRFTIDDEACLKHECGKCLDACNYHAIDLDESTREITVHVSAIVVATGWELYDASNIPDLQFRTEPDVLTSLMLERMASPNGVFQGEVLRPSDSEKPKNISFIQCAGSRDENHLPYCSGVCCSASLKQALFLADLLPEANIRIFYIDLRVMGRNEDFLNRVESHPRIDLIKGKVAAIKKSKDNNDLVLESEDTMSGKKEVTLSDLVILATGIVPNNTGVGILKSDDIGFLDGNGQLPGIYTTGCCKKPMDVSMSVKDATGTALKAIQSVVRMQEGNVG